MAEMPRGGKRPGSGRPKLDNVRIECMVPRLALEKLIEREASKGTYRTRIAAEILTQELIGNVVSRS